MRMGKDVTNQKPIVKGPTGLDLKLGDTGQLFAEPRLLSR